MPTEVPQLAIKSAASGSLNNNSLSYSSMTIDRKRVVESMSEDVYNIGNNNSSNNSSGGRKGSSQSEQLWAKAAPGQIR